jgi:hypothetical protein
LFAYEPDVEPDPAGGVAGAPEGGVPLVPEPLPLPMFGQFLVELLLEPELEPDELDELEPELELLVPVLEVLEPDDGAVVEEFVLELDPVLPVDDGVVVVVVAASATNAPPVTRPAVSALIATTFRNRSFMGCCPFVSCAAPGPIGSACTRCAPDLWPGAQRPQRVGGVCRRSDDDSQRERCGRRAVAARAQGTRSGNTDVRRHRRCDVWRGDRTDQRLSARQQ